VNAEDIEKAETAADGLYGPLRRADRRRHDPRPPGVAMKERPRVLAAATELLIAQQHVIRALTALRSSTARRQAPAYYDANRVWVAIEQLTRKLEGRPPAK
jgi:hypothetical protein